MGFHFSVVVSGIAAMELLNKTGFNQRVQSGVDGVKTHRDMFLLDLFPQSFGRRMLVGAKQQSVDRHPLGGHLKALCAQLVCHAIHLSSPKR